MARESIPPLGFVHLLGLTSFTFVRGGGQLFLVCYLGLAFTLTPTSPLKED